MSVSALVEDFRKAGFSGRLAPWDAPCLAERVERRFPGVDPDRLVEAHLNGLRERARLAVRQRVERFADLALVDVGKLLETAAQAADLPADDLVDIVCNLAPAASASEGREEMLASAEIALEDFQRAPARARFAARGQVPTSRLAGLRERADVLFEKRGFAKRRIRHAGGAIFDALPADPSLDDLAAAITAAEPLLIGRHALDAAASLVRTMVHPPVERRCPTPGPNPFFETFISPTETDFARHQSAVRILGTDLMGNLSGIRLATSEGEAVLSATKPDADEAANWKPASLENPAMWPDPTNMPPKLRCLASVDFDPSIETPPPSWLAKGLLPRSGIGLLIGESGAGKSFAAVHTATAVAWGLPLFGAKVKQGAVLYIAAEGGRSVLRRIKAAHSAMEGAVIAANLCRPKGTPLLSCAPIRVVIEAPDLSRDGSPEPLVRTIHAAAEDFEAKGYRLAMVIVDTWHAAMGGGEENSAADAGHALKSIIAEAEAGDFLALIVHHPGKDLDRGARGSNALPASADVIISVSVPGHTGAVAKPSTAMRQAVVTKMRDGEAGGGFAYKLNIVPTGNDEDGEVVTTCVVEPCDPPKLDDDGLNRGGRAVMDALHAAIAESGGERAKFAEVRARFIASLPATMEGAAKRQQWKRALTAAEKAGRIEADEQEFWLWATGSK